MTNRTSAAACRNKLGGLVSALAVVLAVQSASGAEPAHLLADFGRTQIVIEASSQRCILFAVYIAETPDQQRNGLMFVESMDPYEGMLFIYSRPAEISMWMKNTLLPLDMVFFDTDLRIKNIHRNAVPLSEDIINSNGRVIGVIELNGGAAEQFGIQPGDHIILPGTNTF